MATPVKLKFAKFLDIALTSSAILLAAYASHAPIDSFLHDTINQTVFNSVEQVRFSKIKETAEKILNQQLLPVNDHFVLDSKIRSWDTPAFRERLKDQEFFENEMNTLQNMEKHSTAKQITEAPTFSIHSKADALEKIQLIRDETKEQKNSMTVKHR